MFTTNILDRLVAISSVRGQETLLDQDAFDPELICNLMLEDKDGYYLKHNNVLLCYVTKAEIDLRMDTAYEFYARFVGQPLPEIREYGYDC